MQVVGYRPVPESALLLAGGGPVERLTLTAGTELTHGLGERHCAGTIQNDHHIPCQEPRTPYCRRHESQFDESTLRERTGEHAVYLAAFAPDVFKVGITRRDRLETRLREQGADRGAHLQTVPDGDTARDVEERLGRDLTQRVRTRRKLASLARSVDAAAWDELLDEYDPLATFRFDYALDLATQPVHETLASGTVRGVQGRILVLDRDGTTYAVDMRDLVGHELTDCDERPLQSSLGSFE
ncbi:DUF2797 domain-containing protein [Halosegnis rubeus]|jgi:hypothetical protein|uniref:DUF2797 domain-containing protein n=1 Tax=Halosegnis rubeus TaxID=2212850 RepID=A0A5N5U445_9EURY|nr:DUF2797 domain-containing protein [Halosegnis rubeus]KAB7513333.1 DUF2797 domain-containing protein [Halosegnis rubeus]KAB7517316.1 DUF2797 domain-containing protein [Halosegnis rubeus]